MHTHGCIDANARVHLDKFVQVREAGRENNILVTSLGVNYSGTARGCRLTNQKFKISCIAAVSRLHRDPITAKRRAYV